MKPQYIRKTRIMLWLNIVHMLKISPSLGGGDCSAERPAGFTQWSPLAEMKNLICHVFSNLSHLMDVLYLYFYICHFKERSVFFCSFDCDTVTVMAPGHWPWLLPPLDSLSNRFETLFNQLSNDGCTPGLNWLYMLSASGLCPSWWASNSATMLVCYH